MLDGLIYVEQISERINYLEFTFFEQRGLKIQFTNDFRTFSEFEGEKLNYSNKSIECKQLVPSSLLFEETIREQQIESADWNGITVLAFDGVYDPLATIFYVLVRYEEYLPSVRDMHDRYLAKNSLLKRFFSLKEQTVERIFFHFLAETFQSSFSKYRLGIKSNYIPTFDIDNTFAFQWKEGWRTWASNAKDILKSNTERKLLRKKVQAKELKDPFDSWEEIKAVAHEFPLTKVFWLLGDFKKFDKNISWNDPRHQRLIREIGVICEVGLHPSYASNTEPQRLDIEKSRLQQILSNQVCLSRQHFLKLKFPQTYQNLISVGFKHDYSLGYAEEIGFRTGTAHTHYWFDLSKNIRTELQLHPFAYMDGTLNEYLKLTPEQSSVIICELMDEVKSYGGEFICLWHNESFAESGIWKNWRKVFEQTSNYWVKGESHD